jgi:hypothetical protein
MSVIFHKYICKEEHMLLYEFFDELKINEDVNATKAEILKTINNIDPSIKDPDIAAKNEALLDSIYTILNKGNMIDRIGGVLPGVLKGEFAEKQIMQIAGIMADAPLTFAQKVDFARNLQMNKCINHKLLTTPGVSSIDQLCYNSDINKTMFMHLSTYGVGAKMKGPYENGLAIMSTNISIKGKGDIDVDGVGVEVKGALGVNGGRFGETGDVPPVKSVQDIMYSYEWLKAPLDAQRDTSVTGSVNLKTLTKLINQIPNVPPQERQDLANRLADLYFGAQGKRLKQALGRMGADPVEVNRAWIKDNFDSYKAGDSGGKWSFLVGIIAGYNTIGVVSKAEDLDNMTTTGNTIYPLYGKPMEAFFQFNPKK